VLTTPVLNNRAQQIGIQSVQRAACHSMRSWSVVSVVFWTRYWAFLLDRSQLGLFPKPGNVSLFYFFMSRLKRAAMWGAMTFSEPLPWRLGTFVGTFDESGSDRVKSRGGGDIHVRSVLLGQVQQFVICGHVERRWIVVVSATQGNGVFSARNCASPSSRTCSRIMCTPCQTLLCACINSVSQPCMPDYTV